jgi:excisionase family DNA binding protein
VGISAKEAAELVGVSKNAIFKAIKSGKLSAAKDTNGEWRIEPVELFRVYEPVNDSSRTSPQPSSPQAIDGLQRENELLRETVADLRARLDAESEERRRLSLILTESQQPPKSKSWWAKLLGG